MTTPADHSVLICAPNWLGDAVMCMPAIRLFRKAHPEAALILLSKRRLCELWAMNRDTDRVLAYDPTFRGTLAARAVLRERRCAQAFVMPNSFRAALIPFLAGIPERIGFRGHHGRAWMLHRVVPVSSARRGRHQWTEAFSLLGLPVPDALPPPPYLFPDERAASEMRDRLGQAEGEERIGLIPGAARGPSKRWPPEHFIAVGRALASSRRARLLVLGAPAEAELCRRVADGIGPAALDLGGRTSLPQLAAALSLCRAVVANDSGGMHLAAAVGAPVVAVYGLTDPNKTGPLGPSHLLVAPGLAAGDRDIARRSDAAELALRNIAPEQVVEAVAALLART